MAAFTQAWVPMCWEAFDDYRRQGLQLSRLEIGALRRILSGDDDATACDAAGLKGREAREFAGKLATLRAQADE